MKTLRLLRKPMIFNMTVAALIFLMSSMAPDLAHANSSCPEKLNADWIRSWETKRDTISGLTCLVQHFTNFSNVSAKGQQTTRECFFTMLSSGDMRLKCKILRGSKEDRRITQANIRDLDIDGSNWFENPGFRSWGAQNMCRGFQKCATLGMAFNSYSRVKPFAVDTFFIEPVGSDKQARLIAVALSKAVELWTGQ